MSSSMMESLWFLSFCNLHENVCQFGINCAPAEPNAVRNATKCPSHVQFSEWCLILEEEWYEHESKAGSNRRGGGKASNNSCSEESTSLSPPVWTMVAPYEIRKRISKQDKYNTHWQLNAELLETNKKSELSSNRVDQNIKEDIARTRGRSTARKNNAS